MEGCRIWGRVIGTTNEWKHHQRSGVTPPPPLLTARNRSPNPRRGGTAGPPIGTSAAERVMTLAGCSVPDLSLCVCVCVPRYNSDHAQTARFNRIEVLPLLP